MSSVLIWLTPIYAPIYAPLSRAPPHHQSVGRIGEVADIETCAALCVDSGYACKAVEFNGAACVLKAAGGTEASTELSDRWSYWNREAYCDTPSTTGCTGGALDDFLVVAGRMFSTTVSWGLGRTAEHCAEICVDEGALCVAFAFDRKTRTCAMADLTTLLNGLRPIRGVDVHQKVGLTRRGCTEVTTPSVTPKS